MLDNSSGDFIYKSDLLLFLERERRRTEQSIAYTQKQDCGPDTWNAKYLEQLKDRLKIIEDIIRGVNE